jgi:hypothetical protein
MAGKSLEDLTPNELIGLASLSNQLANDPETRTEFLRMLKKKNPSMAIPEIDASDAVNKRVDDLKKENQELRDKFQENELRQSITLKRGDAMKKHHLSDDQMTEVEKLMLEKHLPDYDTAAEFFSMSQRIAAPTAVDSVANPDFSMPVLDTWKAGIGNKTQLDKIARSEAYKAWNEISGGNPLPGGNPLGRAS